MSRRTVLLLMFVMWIVGIVQGFSIAGGFDDDCFVPEGRETIVDECETP